MLMYLCSYSQDLYVRNDSAFTITVSGFYETTLGNCNDGSGTSGSITPGNTGWITGAAGAEFTVIRASDGGTNTVVSESGCGTGCDSPSNNGLNASWHPNCLEVTIY
jgi:hypothetical protein